jgi:hypothetical protein
MKIKISTYFDCTATGITAHFRQAQIPMLDKAGQKIASEQEWHRSRNQQRNFETLTQLVGLYTQPMDLTKPTYCRVSGMWEFEFTAEFPGVFSLENDSLGLLTQQANGVPMIIGLTETQTLQNWLIPNSNIFFQELNIT